MRQAIDTRREILKVARCIFFFCGPNYREDTETFRLVWVGNREPPTMKHNARVASFILSIILPCAVAHARPDDAAPGDDAPISAPPAAPSAAPPAAPAPSLPPPLNPTPPTPPHRDPPPTETPLTIPDDPFQPKGPHCCAIVYNGSPVCSLYQVVDLKFYQKQVCGTLDVNGSVIENPDCTYLNPTAENPQGICMP